jgi:type II secretory pathway pseudopilin PulG
MIAASRRVAANGEETFGVRNSESESAPAFHMPNSRLHAHSVGYSLLELMFALGLAMTMSAMAAPQLLAGVDEYRTAGAARYVSARLQSARMEAVMRSRAVAIRFERVNGRYAFAMYVDGNHNGVLTSDIARGVDERVVAAELLAERFAGVDFGTVPGLPAVEAGGQPPGDDPIRLGAGSMATFTAIGTATPGSVYVRGRHSQYVVRIFGATGKTRVQRFNTRTRQWKPL